MTACEPAELMADASCFDCLDEHGLLSIIASKLCVQAGMSCNPATLAAASKCFECIDNHGLLAIIAMQLCLIQDAGIPLAFEQQIYVSAGNPNGVITPSTVLPSLCIDTINNVVWAKSDGLLTNTGWGSP